jgi:hypothetical protein
MPAPTNERQRLEREWREELPARLAIYQQKAAGELDKVRREQVEWQIRRIEKRMATVRGWPRMFRPMTVRRPPDAWRLC